MTMRCECIGCGEDCSHGYATHMGDPYHFGCLPERPKRKTAPQGGEKVAAELFRFAVKQLD